MSSNPSPHETTRQRQLAPKARDPQQHWVTARTLRQYVDVSYVTLWRWRSHPNFPPYRTVNGRNFYDWPAVERWMRSRSEERGMPVTLAPVTEQAVAKTLDHLKAEIAAAPSRDDALAILCAAAFPALPDAERARALDEITDILAELPEVA